MNEVIIDRDLIEKGRSRKGAWSREQLELLGVRWPLKRGWRRRMIGTVVQAKDAKRFLDLKDAHLKNKSINGSTPMNFCPYCGHKL